MATPTTIPGKCTGCHKPITYTVDLCNGVPEVYPPTFSIAYAGGHLCRDCARIVDAALTSQRAAWLAEPAARCDECGETSPTTRHVEDDARNCNACTRCVP